MTEVNNAQFTVGELAEKSGVTVRTLQYYDKSGLLRATLNDRGRRTYSRDDVFRLQRILFLKSLGFSLDEIRNILQPQRSPDDLERILTQQHEILIERVKNLTEIIHVLELATGELHAGGKISLERLVAILTLMKEGNTYAFLMRYFGDDQLRTVTKRIESGENYDDYMQRTHKAFAELECLYREGANPAGPEGQAFAKRWWEMVSEFTKGDMEMLKSLVSAGLDTAHWPSDAQPLKDATEQFLGKALDIYLRNQGIELPKMEAKPND